MAEEAEPEQLTEEQLTQESEQENVTGGKRKKQTKKYTKKPKTKQTKYNR